MSFPITYELNEYEYDYGNTEERGSELLQFLGIYERLLKKVNNLVEHPLEIEIVDGIESLVPGADRRKEMKLMQLPHTLSLIWTPKRSKAWAEIEECVHEKWKVEIGIKESKDKWIQMRDRVNSRWKKMTANRSIVSTLVRQSKRKRQK